MSCSRRQNLPDGKSNKGRVEAYYGPIYIADAALYLKTHKPELGINDPYELTQKQFDAAVELLQGAAQDRAEILERRHRADRGLQERRRGRLAPPGPIRSTCCAARKQPDRQDRAGGRRHRMGGHHHDAFAGAASELRLYVARAFAPQEAAGRSRLLVRLGAGRARGLQGQCAPRRQGCETNGVENFDKIRSGRRRSPIAATGENACRTRIG